MPVLFVRPAGSDLMKRPTFWERLGTPSDWPRRGPHSGYVMCPECGRHGFVGGTWADACLRNGHPYLCVCGQKFSSATGAAGHVRLTRDGDHALVDTDSES